MSQKEINQAVNLAYRIGELKGRIRQKDSEIEHLRQLCMDVAQRGISPEHARRLINGAWAEAEEG